MLRLLITSVRVWLQATTRKFHKSFRALPCSCYAKIKYLAARLILYFTYSTHSNALMYIWLSFTFDVATVCRALLLSIRKKSVILQSIGIMVIK